MEWNIYICRGIMSLCCIHRVVCVCGWMDLFFLMDRSTSGGVFWGVCGLIMILGSLSVNGWGCVPVLLVLWHRVSSTVACWSLSGAGSWH